VAARRALLDDSLAGVPVVSRFAGAIVDVGSGGGAPGIPLAHALPDREVVLLEAERRKCSFLEHWAPSNARVVWGRAEEQELDWAGVAVAKALAQPPTALEWCLPLVRPGGAAVLWVGPTADAERVARIAERLAGELEESREGFIVVRKTGPTPAGFPRRTGVAKKRPLG
jgi:16S rRNA (guanine527-N7)-methyltransferase